MTQHPGKCIDQAVIDGVKETIAELGRRGKTVFFSSHVLAETEAVCDRVAFFNQNLVEVGTPTELARKLFSRMTMIELGGKRLKAWKGYPEALEGIEGVAVREDPDAVQREGHVGQHLAQTNARPVLWRDEQSIAPQFSQSRIYGDGNTAGRIISTGDGFIPQSSDMMGQQTCGKRHFRIS